MWMDMGIDRAIDEDDVRGGWAESFGLPLGAIAVTRDWGDLDRCGGPHERVVIARFENVGDFPMTLSVVLRDDEMEARFATDEASSGAVQRFCAALDCRAIMASEADDEHSWTLVSPTQRWRIRGYDPDQVGDRLADARFEALTVAA